eukprot:CAMPEP_0118903542 /NCGR_PEP_ID=MMETSP1166-20130328/8365_1 /TAXON_ID=1104430 /ORGANISM="Chrysoreinhardia sp, Strain CCMP3193" /LENGTH=468 /DNA_ID=CAMNT_0006842771 /DNA_START=27 /DNA_END=1433 /DNA_ORIENTATION=-
MKYVVGGVAVGWLMLKLRRPLLSSWAFPVVGHNIPFASDPETFFDGLRARFGSVFTVDIYLQVVTIFLGEAGVRDILRSDGKAVKSNWPLTFQKLLGPEAVTVAHGPRHRSLRKAMLITPQTIKGTLGVVAALVRFHVDQWIFSEEGPIDDILAKTKRLSFDIAIAVFFGEGSSEVWSTKKTDDVVETFKTWLDGFVALIPIDHDAFTFGKAMSARRKLVQDHFGPIIDAIEAQGANAPPSVCKDLLAVRLDDEQPRLSRGSIVDNLITLLFAAHDTTAHTTASALYLLQRTPGGSDAVQACRDELDALWPDGSPSSWTTLPSTPVLDAVTKEMLRLGNPVPCLFKKVHEPLTVAGKAVNPGQNLGISLVTTLRDPTAFPDPQRFDYTRFTGNDPADKRHPYSYCPFGSGVRVCLGQNLAVTELRLILATLLKHADWDLTGENLDSPPRKADFPFIGFNPKVTIKNRS